MRTLIRVKEKGYFKSSDRAGYDIRYTDDPAKARSYAAKDLAETQAHNLWLAGEGEYELIPGRTVIRHTPPKLDWTGPKARLWRKRRSDGKAENALTMFAIDGRRRWESGIELEIGYMRFEQDARRLVSLWHDAEGVPTSSFDRRVIQKMIGALAQIEYANGLRGCAISFDLLEEVFDLLGLPTPEGVTK